MRKLYILLLIFLYTSHTTIAKSECNTNNLACIEKDYYTEDEFDSLIGEAEETNAVPDKIEIPKPSKVEMFLRKIGITFFLKPYIFLVESYRSSKNCIITYAQLIWSAIWPKKEETNNNET